MKIYLTLAIISALTYSCKPKVTPNQDTNIPSTIQAVDLDEYMSQHRDAVLLDVRTPEEIAEGKIQGAIEIDYRGDNFEAEIDKLDKNKHYIVYCRSGGRSASSIEVMRSKGISKCTNVEGGYNSYSETKK